MRMPATSNSTSWRFRSKVSGWSSRFRSRVSRASAPSSTAPFDSVPHSLASTSSICRDKPAASLSISCICWSSSESFSRPLRYKPTTLLRSSALPSRSIRRRRSLSRSLLAFDDDAGLAQELQNVAPDHLFERLAPDRLGGAAFAVRAEKPAGALVAVASIVKLPLAAGPDVRDPDVREVAAGAFHQPPQKVMISRVPGAEEEVGRQILPRLGPRFLIYDGRHRARDRHAALGSRALPVLVDALVRGAHDQVSDPPRAPEARSSLFALAAQDHSIITPIGAGHPQFIQPCSDLVARRPLDRRHLIDHTDDIAFGEVQARDGLLGDYKPRCGLLARLPVAVWHDAAEPCARAGNTVGAVERTLQIGRASC